MNIGYNSTLWMNDKQYGALRSAFDVVNGSVNPAELIDCGIPISVSNLIPDSVNDDYWVPDAWGPFATLEQSDESWARPMGLGRVISRQKAIAGMIVNYREWQESLMRRIAESMLSPPPEDRLDKFLFRDLFDYSPRPMAYVSNITC